MDTELSVNDAQFQELLSGMVDRCKTKLRLCVRSVHGLEVMRRILLDEFVFTCALSFKGTGNFKVDFERKVETIVGKQRRDRMLILANGQIDYVFVANGLIVTSLSLEAKHDELTRGTAQVAAEIITVAEVSHSATVCDLINRGGFAKEKQYHYGIVSNANQWRFLRVDVFQKTVEWCEVGTLDLVAAVDPDLRLQQVFEVQCTAIFRRLHALLVLQR